MPRVSFVAAAAAAVAVAAVLGGAGAARAADADAWRGRTIYQLLTDRFARTDPNDERPCDLSSYCGGSYRGAARMLDYVADMGFDAIWISPYVENTPGGYHGYWSKNLFKLNENFGSADDLKHLVAEAHRRGMYVMMDVVANHMGPVQNDDFSQLSPFNSSAHYHACSACARDNCQIADFTCFRDEIQLCRLAGLPDLNQTAPFVRDQLYAWVRHAVAEYGFDGLRVDTVPEVARDFWPGFQAAAGVYTVGEVFSSLDCCKAYSDGDGLDAVLSFPLAFAMRDVFANGGSMFKLRELFVAYNAFRAPELLGTFVDNHDIDRFLHLNADQRRFQNALLYTLYSRGIPIMYYGSEQGFDGGHDPLNREPLWVSAYNRKHALYEYVRTVVRHRRDAQLWRSEQVERYAANDFYAFSRNTTFAAITNVGKGGPTVRYTISFHPYDAGTRLCNIFFPTADCITVSPQRTFDVVLLDGESKVFVPVGGNATVARPSQRVSVDVN